MSTTELATTSEISFQPALELLSRQGRGWSEPISFRQYVAAHFGTARAATAKTAQFVSVQSWGGLRPELKEAGAMVFRLGGGTFALAHAGPGGLAQDYFLLDEQLFSAQATTYIPDASYLDIYPFQLLGTLQEGGAVNLAVASGVLAHALRLDRPFSRVAPARGASVYDFPVRPRSDCSAAWEHKGGQVEVDCVFFGKRNNSWKLFVIEAKHGRPDISSRLPKYKLVYPVSVLASKGVPRDIEIVPVYVRSWFDRAAHTAFFAIAECTLPNPRAPVVSSLEPAGQSILAMPLAMLGPSSAE